MNKQSISCKTTHRKLATVDNEALYLWCKTCKTEHRITRDEVNQLWMNQSETKAQVTIK